MNSSQISPWADKCHKEHSKIYLTFLSCSNKKFQALDNPFLPYLRIRNFWTTLKQIGYCLKEENPTQTIQSMCPRLRISMFVYLERNNGSRLETQNGLEILLKPDVVREVSG